MRKQNVISKLCSCAAAATLCTGTALAQAPPAVTPRPEVAAAGKSIASTAVLNPKTRDLLRTTAAKMGMAARGAAPAVSPVSSPKVEVGPAAPAGPAGTAPGTNVTSGVSGAHLPYIPPAILQESIRRSMQCVQTTKQGDQLVKEGNWNAAVERYASALQLNPTYQAALYGIASCAGAAGDVGDELAFYRRAIYAVSYTNDDGYGFRENMVPPLMKFVLILSQAGQAQEALTVYRRAITLLDYDQGKPSPSLPILLPEMGPAGATYTPQRLQAMAQVALALKSWGNTQKQLALLTEAVRLAPDSVAANYYLGNVYDLENHRAAARPYYERARQLGDASVRALVDEDLKRCLTPEEAERVDTQRLSMDAFEKAPKADGSTGR